jgi:hypothetical protein
VVIYDGLCNRCIANYNGCLNRRYTLVRLLREIIVALRDLA